MPRSFRLVPPEPRRDLLARPRLMRQLVERWDRRVTTLVGGAGLGKTTLLVQAMAENRLLTRGLDVWVGLEATDRDAERLARAVTNALAQATAQAVRDQDTGPVRLDRTRRIGALPAAEVADALWHLAPEPVCLLFDEVQRLVSSSQGAAWLSELIDALPANAHVVLAGRTEPPVPLSRLEAAGALLRLDQDDLRFSPDELAAFADRRSIDPAQLTETGGWPAVAELTANVDRRLTGVYLWEEVLEPLGDERRAVLAAVADLGGADDELASAALDQPVDLAGALDGVPLIDRTASGWYGPHSLWRQAPRLALDAPTRAGLRDRAVRFLLARGRFDDAFSLVEEAQLWDLAPVVLRAACLASDRLAAGQLARWLSASPREVRESSSGVLARGLLAAFTAPTTAAEPLQRAIERCRTDGDVDSEMSAIAQLARLAWFRQDDAILGQLVTRVGELQASGHPAATALFTVAGAALADLAGEDRQLLELLDSIEPTALDRTWDLLLSFWAAQVRLGLGQTAAIHEIVDRLDPGDDPVLHGAGLAIQVAAWWAEGQVDLVVACLSEMVEGMRASGVQHSLYLALNGACLVCARTGDVVAARRFYDESVAAGPVGAGGTSTMRSAMARAYLHLAEGDEDQATAVLREAATTHGVNQGIDRDTWRQHIALSYVLLPETRDLWDGLELSGHLHAARNIAQALVAVREGRAESALREMELPPTGVVRAALDVRFAVELAAGLGAAGRTADARALLEALGPLGREALRDLTRGSGPPTGPAKALLAAVPAAPPYPTFVGVLGPMLLQGDGPAGPRGLRGPGEPDEADALAVASDPELRRTKLRELLGFLVVRRRTSRAAVAGALWPDLDERAAFNNLGVTLNRLLRVLEPWRHSGEPSSLLRLEGQSIRLVADEHLRVDVDEFDLHLEAAAEAEADGLPSVALEHDLAALELYRGDLFSDLPEAEWFILDRERHRIRFVGAAVRAGQLLLARGDVDGAEKAARRALTVDRWSEDAYAVLVTAAMARRNRSGAHRMLTICLGVLEELGAEPSAATRQLQRRVIGTEPAPTAQAGGF